MSEISPNRSFPGFRTGSDAIVRKPPSHYRAMPALGSAVAELQQ